VCARVSTSPVAASLTRYSIFRRFSHSTISARTFSFWLMRAERTYFARMSTIGQM
jgi:hypothetical protein